MLKKFPDMIPGSTWGSMNSREDKKKWGKNKCDDVVGGSSKANCPGSFQNLSLKHFYCSMHNNLRYFI